MARKTKTANEGEETKTQTANEGEDGGVKIRLNCRYGGKLPGDTVEVPEDQAKAILGIGWGERVK